MTRSYDTSWPDEPEAIVAERIEAIAYDLERIADALEVLVDEEERRHR